jgi:hypothetical protein
VTYQQQIYEERESDALIADLVMLRALQREHERKLNQPAPDTLRADRFADDVLRGAE